MGNPAQSTYRAFRLLLVLGLAWPFASHAQPASATAESERMRRLAGVEEAEMLLQKGDEAYQKGNFADASQAYAGARELLPAAPLTAELRRAATDRYAQAAVEHARQLVRTGDLAAAGTIVDRVLQPDAAPNDPGALAFRAQLDDPLRTNPALTAQHARDVDEVRRLLYTAEGAYDLGKFDEAKKHYESVLRIDPANTAARRGMERVAGEVQSYARSAYDHTRAAMLADVEKQWETALPQTYENLPAGSGSDTGPLDDFGPNIQNILDQTVLPQVMLSQATLSEAIDYLRSATRQTGPEARTINFNINLGTDDSPRSTRIRSMKFDLQLGNVPLRQVLKIITEMTQTTFTTDGYSVVIRPLGSDSQELVDRTFRVPPDFLTSLAAGAGSNTEQANDPFAAEANSRPGLLTARMSAQEAFARQGVGFPPGSHAHYSAGNSTLSVRNTENNMDIIQQIVDSISRTEPVLVAVRVTMITTAKQHLEELGFDWLLSPVALGDDVFAAGGTIGNSAGRTGADFTSPINGAPFPGVPLDATAQVTDGVITNGLRSGDSIISGNSLDAFLNNPNRAAQQSSVAPGILSLSGLFTDGQVQSIMRGFSQKKGVDIMARPSVITRPGVQASVDMIQEFPYATEYEEPQIPTSVGDGAAPVTPANPSNFEFRTVGVEFKVLANADAEKRFIDLTLEPSFSKFDGFVNYGSPITAAVPTPLGGAVSQQLTENAILMPVFSVQRSSTQITVADGSTIAFGGLMTDRVQQAEDKVPILGQLPLVGRLFTSTASQPITTAIIFMVNVELIDPTGRPYRDR